MQIRWEEMGCDKLFGLHWGNNCCLFSCFSVWSISLLHLRTGRSFCFYLRFQGECRRNQSWTHFFFICRRVSSAFLIRLTQTIDTHHHLLRGSLRLLEGNCRNPAGTAGAEADRCADIWPCEGGELLINEDTCRGNASMKSSICAPTDSTCILHM